MFLFLFLFGLALGAESPPDGHQMNLQRGECPMFWYSFNSRCYKYVSSRFTWADAELHCVSEGANLVSIHSLEEEIFVRGLIMNFDHIDGRSWIGLSDIHKEGSWMWSDGCTVNFVFWNAGEPNNYGGNEHCVLSNYETDRKWNDGQCHDPLPFVCASRIICPQQLVAV